MPDDKNSAVSSSGVSGAFSLMPPFGHLSFKGHDGQSRIIQDIAKFFEQIRDLHQDSPGEILKMASDRFYNPKTKDIRDHQIKDAIELLRSKLEQHPEKLKHRGRAPLQNYYLPFALMVDKLELDKDEKTTVIASLLYDLVSEDMLSRTELEQRGFSPAVISLTEQLARVTAVPITIHKTGTDGYWSEETFLYNKMQHGFGRDLLTGTKDRELVWWIKIISAIQQLRVIHKEQYIDEDYEYVPTEERDMQVQHIKGMYLPFAREVGFPFSTEMQDLLVRIIDPEGYKAIRDLLDRRGLLTDVEAKVIDPIKKMMSKEVPSGTMIEGRRKSIYSIWNKMLEKQYLEEQEAEIEKKARHKFDGASQKKSTQSKFKARRSSRLFPGLSGLAYEEAIERTFAKLGDIVGVRAIIPDGSDYLTFFGNIRQSFRLAMAAVCKEEPKDYIKFPKSNAYRAHQTKFELIIDNSRIDCECQILYLSDHLKNATNHEAFKETRSEKHEDIKGKKPDRAKDRQTEIFKEIMAKLRADYIPGETGPTYQDPDKYAEIVKTVKDNMMALLMSEPMPNKMGREEIRRSVGTVVRVKCGRKDDLHRFAGGDGADWTPPTVEALLKGDTTTKSFRMNSLEYPRSEACNVRLGHSASLVFLTGPAKPSPRVRYSQNDRTRGF
jgi:hypothetical protein